MTGPPPRPLPGQPSLRYLKLEAKRRLAAGEFETLHDAQLAIAREHGTRSWSALRQLIGDQAQPDSPVLWQLRWIAARFRDARQAGWPEPDDTEMRQHFADEFLDAIKAEQLTGWIMRLAADLTEELRVIARGPLAARAEIAGIQVLATAEPRPPHRITGLRVVPGGRRVTDERATGPVPVRSAGEVPAWAAQSIEPAFHELGVAGLVLAGARAGADGARDGAQWIVMAGWAELDRREALHTGHRFAAPGVTALVTATAVLKLAADGRIGIDAAANGYLRSVRLADDSITVRELLTHSAGVDGPQDVPVIAEDVPDLAGLTGPVVACDGPRGVIRPGNYGYAVLGQLIADVTGLSFAEAATRLVLAPLAMTRSSFPARTADLGPDAVTGYELTVDGSFTRVPDRIATLPAVGGLWATAGDVLRLATGWASLLPGPVAKEALTPQATAGTQGYQAGTGWLLTPRGDTAMHAGTMPGATACLLERVRDKQVHLTLATRLVLVDSISRQVLRGWAAA